MKGPVASTCSLFRRIFLILFVVFPAAAHSAVPNAIHIQGTLESFGGEPVTGTHDYRIRFFPIEIGGASVATVTGTVTLPSGGRFSIEFVPPQVLFGLKEVWYDLAIDTGDDGLSPDDTFPDRVQMGSVPFALLSRNAESLGGSPASQYLKVENGASNAWLLNGNAGVSGKYLGTTDNERLELRVNGAAALALIPGVTVPSISGGYGGNVIGATVEGGTISGGGRPTGANQALSDFATIGGGSDNLARGEYATVGGGVSNSVDGDASSIGGGLDNHINGGKGSTIGGGGRNRASGPRATIGGGYANTAVGEYSVIPGGSLNSATGDYSFAAGRRASAPLKGSFVWADSLDFNFYSSKENEFAIRAKAGLFLDSENSEYAASFINRGDGDGVRISSHSSQGPNYAALYALNSGSSPGIRVSSTGGTAAVFIGDIDVSGNVLKAAGGSKIDHPLDPENKTLSHWGIESSEIKNVYDGVIVLDSNGEAWVELPAWFEALNEDFRYQLTCVGAFSPVYIAEEITNNRFRIAGGAPESKICWQVTGVRRDPYAKSLSKSVEEEKPMEERGKYLHPEAYGLPRAKGIKALSAE